MDVSNSDESKLASVLSLSLHRLQRAPRAVHRAFLARPSLFRRLRSVKDVYHADGVAFLRDQVQTELCAIQMIAQAQSSILLVGEAGAVLRAALSSSSSEKPYVEIREIPAENGEWALVTDERVAVIGQADLGIAVEGEIARAVSDVFQYPDEVSSHRKPLPKGRTNWPLRTRLDLEAIEVGLSRTWTSKSGRPVTEIERLLLNAIRSARRFIYIEAPHLTSSAVVNALISCLKAKEGPDVVLILPTAAAHTPSPFRRLVLASVHASQAAALRRILACDRKGRFRVYERPSASTSAPLLIVDDQFVKIGTSDLTSKSLGASRAVDLSIEAVGRPQVVTAIARLRRERIGRMLGLEPSEFDARFLLDGSLIRTIESFFTNTRYLVEVSPEPVLTPKSWRIALILFIIFALLVTFVSLFAQLSGLMT
jgi:hypothetical protein